MSADLCLWSVSKVSHLIADLAPAIGSCAIEMHCDNRRETVQFERAHGLGKMVARETKELVCTRQSLDIACKSG